MGGTGSLSKDLTLCRGWRLEPQNMAEQAHCSNATPGAPWLHLGQFRTRAEMSGPARERQAGQPCCRAAYPSMVKDPRPTFPQGEGQQLVEPGMAQFPGPSTGPLQGSGHKSHSLRRIWIHQTKYFSQIF